MERTHSETAAPKRVTAALIEENGRFLLGQRLDSGRFANLWEFPGGKVDPGETPEACVRREIMEELGIDVEAGPLVLTTTYDYGDFSVELYAFECRWIAGDLVPCAHQTLAWKTPREMRQLDLLPADWPIVDVLEGRNA